MQAQNVANPDKRRAGQKFDVPQNTSNNNLGDYPHSQPIPSREANEQSERATSDITRNGQGGLPFFHGIISLRDMNEFGAQRMVHVTSCIEQVNKSAIYHGKVRAEWNQNEAIKLKAMLEPIIPDLESLSLGMTKVYCQRLIIDLPELKTAADAEARSIELKNRLNDEFSLKHFLWISEEDLNFYNKPLLAGEQFKEKFPKANIELTEAGSCFALDRHTACVCHVMRALEYTLKSFAGALSIPSTNLFTWGDFLRAIETRKGSSGKGKTANNPAIMPEPSSVEWLSDEPFFEKCYSFIAAVKSAYRDKTFHVEASYEKPSAKDVLITSIVFFKHAATKLKE